ncbi:F-actin-capping protein subunit alpha [Cichlidogyrus casuarinus]|uniref:F-actin-capping protein subunit alpha n=1 Tax=Cichlidogyrus casuarinus TaxID=1844966 RepID=A0ABD2Q833_9PLAT
MDLGKPAPMRAPGDAASRAELFASLNKGEAVTSGLRKVTDDMKTHKNPNLRASNMVSEVKKQGTAFGGAAAKVEKKPPCKELRGNKWCVEFFENNSNIEVCPDEIKQSVYVYKCSNCTIQIKGKANSIVLDNCKKVGVVFESIIACLDLVNCQSVQAQVTQDLPAVNIDKTDGATIYLSEKSKSADIVTAKSSSVNITIPTADGDFVEYPIPEQFKSKFDGKKMVTTITESI